MRNIPSSERSLKKISVLIFCAMREKKGGFCIVEEREVTGSPSAGICGRCRIFQDVSSRATPYPVKQLCNVIENHSLSEDDDHA